MQAIFTFNKISFAFKSFVAAFENKIILKRDDSLFIEIANHNHNKYDLLLLQNAMNEFECNNDGEQRIVHVFGLVSFVHSSLIGSCLHDGDKHMYMYLQRGFIQLNASLYSTVFGAIMEFQKRVLKIRMPVLYDDSSVIQMTPEDADSVDFHL
jgi:hypothetical protein